MLYHNTKYNRYNNIMDGYYTDSTLLISFFIGIIYMESDFPIPLFTLNKSNMKPGRKLNI